MGQEADVKTLVGSSNSLRISCHKSPYYPHLCKRGPSQGGSQKEKRPECFSRGRMEIVSFLNKSATNKSPFMPWASKLQVPHRGGIVPEPLVTSLFVASEALLGPEGADHRSHTGQLTLTHSGDSWAEARLMVGCPSSPTQPTGIREVSGLISLSQALFNDTFSPR